MSAYPGGWSVERHSTGMVTARSPGGEVAIEESCRRCGARVIGALDATGRGVYLESNPEQPIEFRDAMPFAAPHLKRHFHPEAR